MKQEFVVIVTPPEDAEISIESRIVKEKTGHTIDVIYADGHIESQEITFHRPAMFLHVNGVEIGEMVSVKPVKED